MRLNKFIFSEFTLFVLFHVLRSIFKCHRTARLDTMLGKFKVLLPISIIPFWPFPPCFPDVWSKQKCNVYWGIWSILHPFWKLNEKSCTFCVKLTEVNSFNLLCWRYNCMQEDTTPSIITIARKGQTLPRRSWNAVLPPSIYILLHCKGQS